MAGAGIMKGIDASWWKKKPIDRMEMLHLLGVIYGKTGGRFEKVGLRRLIDERGKPTIRPKVNFIIKALIRTEILFVQGNKGRSRAYKWNLSKYGPVTLALADMVIAETAKQVIIRAKEYRQNIKARASVDNL
jgi:hypothetical protein